MKKFKNTLQQLFSAKPAVILLLVSTTLLLAWSCRNSSPVTSEAPPSVSCSCDTIAFRQWVNDSAFLRIPEYDATTFSLDSFYTLSTSENKRLWYRDVESPKPTRFTKLWNDYARSNYHANHADFMKQYYGADSIEIAFQFGPSSDLWAYHVFVIRKYQCCYLITRSYFRHARFTYKAFAIMNSAEVDSLYSILRPLPKISSDSIDYAYRGYFADNRNHQKFGIDFENSIDTATGDTNAETLKLFDFVDSKIKWKVSYGH